MENETDSRDRGLLLPYETKCFLKKFKMHGSESLKMCLRISYVIDLMYRKYSDTKMMSLLTNNMVINQIRMFEHNVINWITI